MRLTRVLQCHPMSASISALLLLLVGLQAPPAGAAELWMQNPAGPDTLYVGRPASVEFWLAADGQQVAAAAWPLEFRFTNGNIIGPLLHADGISFSASAKTAFEILTWQVNYGMQVTDPDTTLCAVATIDATGWLGSGVVWTLEFVPRDTGLITIDSVHLAVGPRMEVVNTQAQSLPFTWESRTFAVVFYPIPPPGDVNCDGFVDLTDLVFLGNVLDGFADPTGSCVSTVGDVNGNGYIDQGDYVMLYDLVAGTGP